MSKINIANIICPRVLIYLTLLGVVNNYYDVLRVSPREADQLRSNLASKSVNQVVQCNFQMVTLPPLENFILIAGNSIGTILYLTNFKTTNTNRNIKSKNDQYYLFDIYDNLIYQDVFSLVYYYIYMQRLVTLNYFQDNKLESPRSKTPNLKDSFYDYFALTQFMLSFISMAEYIHNYTPYFYQLISQSGHFNTSPSPQPNKSSKQKDITKTNSSSYLRVKENKTKYMASYQSANHSIDTLYQFLNTVPVFFNKSLFRLNNSVENYQKDTLLFVNSVDAIQVFTLYGRAVGAADMGMLLLSKVLKIVVMGIVNQHATYRIRTAKLYSITGTESESEGYGMGNNCRYQGQGEGYTYDNGGQRGIGSNPIIFKEFSLINENENKNGINLKDKEIESNSYSSSVNYRGE